MAILRQIGRFPSFFRGSFYQTLATLDRPVQFVPLPPRPVVLVPGAFCTSSVMNRLGLKLQELGLSVCVPPSFAFYYSALANLCRLPKAALDFTAWLDEIGTRYGFSEVDVAGHSNGSLIALLAMEMIDGGEVECSVRMRKVFTMAAPFGGLPNARALSAMIPCCRDLITGSDTLRKIESQRGAVAHSLVAEGDFLVPPANQSLSSDTRTVMKDFQHMDFVVGDNDKIERTAREIVKWLGNGC
jgi:pimeloyl-ACP methyl ester carboxylesterase